MKLLELFKELTLHPKNAEELKGLILQLAIQGKLTSKWRVIRQAQQPPIEPASVLLESVRSEKERLIKENKIRKEKEPNEITPNEIPFELPLNWQWVRLIEISSINGGFAFKSSKYVDKGVRVIRISDFDEFGFKSHKIVRYEFTSDLMDYVLEEMNILMAMTGGTVGKSLLVKEITEKMVVNQRVATIKLIPIINEEYVNFVIQTPLIADIVREAKNSTNDNISMGDIKDFYIPLPPLEEQKAIVAIVNQLFAEVEQLETLSKERIQLKEDFVVSALQRLSNGDTAKEWSFLHEHFKTFFTEKSNVKKLREAVLQLAVQGKLTTKWRSANPNAEPASELLKRIKADKELLIKEKKIKKEKPLPAITEDELPYQLPEGWVWAKLSELVSVQDPNPSHRMPKYQIEGIPFISTMNFLGNDEIDFIKGKKVNEVTLNDQIERFEIKPSSFAFSRIGTIGKTCALPIKRTYCLSHSLCVMTPWIEDCNPKFLRTLVMSPDVINQAHSGVQSVGVPDLGLGVIRNFVIGLPSLEEQEAIVEKVNALMALCDALEQEITKNNTQVQDLMRSSLREVLER